MVLNVAAFQCLTGADGGVRMGESLVLIDVNHLYTFKIF